MATAGPCPHAAGAPHRTPLSGLPQATNAASHAPLKVRLRASGLVILEWLRRAGLGHAPDRAVPRGTEVTSRTPRLICIAGRLRRAASDRCEPQASVPQVNRMAPGRS